MIIALAMAGADIGAGTGIGDMRAGAHAIVIKSAARADRTHMRAGMHAMITHIGAGTHKMPDMAAGTDAMIADTSARAGTQSVAAHPHTMLADMHIRAHTQHIDADIRRIGGRRKQRHDTDSGGEMFHGRRSLFRSGR